MTYVIVAERTASAGAEELVLEVARSMIDPTRIEPGNERFEALRDPRDPRRVVFYERYQSEAAFHEHQVTPHYREHVIGRAMPRLAQRRLLALEPIDVAGEDRAGGHGRGRDLSPALLDEPVFGQAT